jgi:surface carbohydrate biosynthesis protein
MNKSGILFNQYFPIGALSLCDESLHKNNTEVKYDIVFISDIVSAEYHSINTNKNYDLFYNLYEKYTKIICNRLNDLAKNNCLRIAIAMRTSLVEPAHKLEANLYEQYKSLTRLPKTDQSSYHVCLNSKLVITIGSTLGYEMLGLNKKVIFCSGIDEISKATYYDPFKTNYYIDNLHNDYLIKSCEVNSFNERILFMLDKSLEKHLEDIGSMKLKYMNFNTPYSYRSFFNKTVQGLIR